MKAAFLIFLFLPITLVAQKPEIKSSLICSPSLLNFKPIEKGKADSCSPQKLFTPFQTPKAAVFCRMENVLSKKYKVNLRIRTGGF